MDRELLVSGMKRKFWIFGTVAAVLIAATGLFAAYRAGLFLPLWISWQDARISGESSGEPDVVVLENKTVRVQRKEEIIWESERGIRVQDVLWCDIDHDDARELLLLCWRRGRYGDSRPFWVEEDEKSWSQHIFIYEWEGNTMRPVWMASELGREVESWAFDEERRLVLTDRRGEETAWDWLSWGLTNIPLAEPRELTFAALGDNLIHRQIYDYAFRNWDGDFTGCYAALADELAQYDVTAIQQEGLFVEEPSDYASFPLIGTPIEVGYALEELGFSVVSCAGNHALDFGTEAIDRTAALFSGAGILTPGIQPTSDGDFQPYALLEENGIRCAFLGFTETTNGHRLPEDTPWVLHTLDDEAQVRQALSDARAAADLVVVFVHWGTEYAAEPNENQLRWAKVFADSGADVVLGTHPHVLQSWDWVAGDGGRETLVYYSLGNCISAQTDPACRLGGLAWFTAAMEGGVCRITDCGLKTVETREENGCYTVALAEP